MSEMMTLKRQYDDFMKFIKHHEIQCTYISDNSIRYCDAVTSCIECIFSKDTGYGAAGCDNNGILSHNNLLRFKKEYPEYLI